MTVQYRSERETVLKVKSLSGAIFEILDFGQVDELSSLHSMLSSFFYLNNLCECEEHFCFQYH